MNGKSYSGTLCPLFLSLSPEVKRLRKKLFRDTLSVFAILYSYIEYLSCICYRQILWITGGRTAIPPACGDPSGVFCQRGKGAKQPNHRGTRTATTTKLFCIYKYSYNKCMNFDWDAAKAERNKAKHGVSFNIATRVFFDLGRIEMYDGRDDHGEDRWATIGYADPAVLFVVYTVRDEETIRIISARKAVPNEQKQYREANS